VGPPFGIPGNRVCRGTYRDGVIDFNYAMILVDPQAFLVRCFGNREVDTIKSEPAMLTSVPTPLSYNTLLNSSSSVVYIYLVMFKK
jgi:hypothetical protein